MPGGEPTDGQSLIIRRGAPQVRSNPGAHLADSDSDSDSGDGAPSLRMRMRMRMKMMMETKMRGEARGLVIGGRP